MYRKLFPALFPTDPCLSMADPLDKLGVVTQSSGCSSCTLLRLLFLSSNSFLSSSPRMLEGRCRTRDSDLLALVPRDVTKSEFLDVGGSSFAITSIDPGASDSEGVSGRYVGASTGEYALTITSGTNVSVTKNEVILSDTSTGAASWIRFSAGATVD